GGGNVAVSGTSGTLAERAREMDARTPSVVSLGDPGSGEHVVETLVTLMQNAPLPDFVRAQLPAAAQWRAAMPQISRLVAPLAGELRKAFEDLHTGSESFTIPTDPGTPRSSLSAVLPLGLPLADAIAPRGSWAWTLW